MSKESEVADILRADIELMALLTGGVYTDQEIGVEGIRRSLTEEDTNPTKDAFDENGILRPCVVIRQAGENIYQNLVLPSEGITAMSQIISIFYYQFRGHDIIDLARQRVYELLFQRQLVRTMPMWMVNQSPTIPDIGPVQNSTVGTQEWIVVFLKRAFND